MILWKLPNKRIYLGIDSKDANLSNKDARAIKNGSIKDITIIINDITVVSIKRIIKFIDVVKLMRVSTKVNVIFLVTSETDDTYEKLIKILKLRSKVDKIWREQSGYCIYIDYNHTILVGRDKERPYAVVMNHFWKKHYNLRHDWGTVFYNTNFCYKQGVFDDRIDSGYMDYQMNRTMKMFNGNSILSKVKTQKKIFPVYVGMVAIQLIKDYNITTEELE